MKKGTQQCSWGGCNLRAMQIILAYKSFLFCWITSGNNKRNKNIREVYCRGEGDLSAGGTQGWGRRSGRRSRPPIERSSFNFFKPTTKIEEIILKSESVLSWFSWLFYFTCHSSWKGRFVERSGHLIKKYRLKRTSWRWKNIRCWRFQYDWPKQAARKYHHVWKDLRIVV